MNRYTNLSTSEFDPMSWEDISRVPMNKRAQHDNMLQAKAEMETSLAQIDSRDVHSDEVRLYQDHMRNKLNDLSQQLSSEGVNDMNKGQILKLNSDYKQAMSPQGRMGRIAASKADLATKKKAFYADKTGHSKEALDKMWNQIQGDQTGYDDDNNIKDVNEAGAFAYKDIPLYVEGILSKAASDVKSKYGSGYGIKKDPKTGLYVMINSKNNQIVKENDSQITAAINELNTFLTDNKNDYGKNVELYGYDIPTLVDQKAQKHLFNHTTGQSSTSASLIPGQFGSNGDSTETNNNPSTSAITIGQEPIAESSEDLNSKIDTLLKNRESMNPNSPGYRQEYDLNVKETRKLTRLRQEGLQEISQNQELLELKKTAEQDNKKYNSIESYLKDEVKTLRDSGEKDAADDLEYRLQAVKDGEDYTVVVDTDQLANEYLPFYTSEIIPKIKEMVALKTSNDRYKNKESELLSNYVKRHGSEEVEFITSSKDSEDKVLFNNLNKALRSVNFKITDVEGLSDDYKNVKFNNNQNGHIHKQMKDLISSSTNQVINFGTDGNTPFLSITATPKEGAIINTNYNDGIGDEKFDGTNSFTSKIPLVEYGNRNIPQMTDFAVHLINNSQLDSQTRTSILKSILTSTISATSDPSTLGETMVSSEMLGIKLNDNYAGIDFYQPLGKNKNIQFYKIPKDKNGKPEPILLKDITASTSIKDDNATQKYLKESGSLKSYINYAKNTKVEDFVNQFKNTLSASDQAYYLKEYPDTTIADIFGGLDPNVTTDEDADNFIEFIKELPLMSTNISSLTNLILK